MKVPALARIALLTTVVTFIVGAWLFLAPFIVSYQNNWKTFADSTRNDMSVGGLLIGVSALALLLFAAFAVNDAVKEDRERSLSNNQDTQREEVAG